MAFSRTEEEGLGEHLTTEVAEGVALEHVVALTTQALTVMENLKTLTRAPSNTSSQSQLFQKKNKMK